MRKAGERISAIKKILVPTDFSPPSEQAVRYAAMMAKRFKAQLILLHVNEPYPYSVTDSMVLVDHSRALKKIAERLLAGQRDRIASQGLRVMAHLAVGSPYQEIIRRAKRDRVQLIVVGTHGRTGVEHLLLGSVAERIVRLAPCPVLTVQASSPSGGRKRS